MVGRDASRQSAQVSDLYVALSEDETIYGLFKTMKGMSDVHTYVPYCTRDAEANLLHPTQSRTKSSARARVHVVDEANQFLVVRTPRHLARLLRNRKHKHLLRTGCAPHQQMEACSAQAMPRRRRPTRPVRSKCSRQVVIPNLEKNINALLP